VKAVFSVATKIPAIVINSTPHARHVFGWRLAFASNEGLQNKILSAEGLAYFFMKPLDSILAQLKNNLWW